MVELLVAGAAMAVLAALSIGAASHALTTARKARAIVELDTIAAALETYRLRHGDYPRTADPAVLLQSLIGRREPTGEPLAESPSILLASMRLQGASDPTNDADAKLVDPWERPYRYAWKTPTGTWLNPRYVLFSSGPDGNPAALVSAEGFVAAAAVENSDDLFPAGGWP